MTTRQPPEQPERTEARPHIPGIVWLLIGLLGGIVLALLFLPLFGQLQPLPAQPAEPADVAPDDRIVPVSDVVDNPALFIGREVTVLGEVEEVLTPQAFVLGADAVEEGPPAEAELLVLEASPGIFAPAPREGKELRVTGTVRRFQLTQLERELGIDLQDDRLSRFEGDLVLVGREVDPGTD